MAASRMSFGKIALVGAGNVASHLAVAFGGEIGLLTSRTVANAEALAVEAGISAWGGLGDVVKAKPDIVIISVADHALHEVVDSIGRLEYNPLVMHTSGTLPKEVLEPISPRTGVLYPLQTFSKDVYVDMHSVPFFTEAEDSADLEIIDSIAYSVSPTVHHADAGQRRVLHIAGVFSSNFVNIILEMVDDVLGEAHYPLSTVRPLVEATVAKAFNTGPHDSQTGPARRGDKSVINSHALALPDDKRKVYELLSEYIIKSHNVKLQ